MVDKFKILVLTDHSKHTMHNSLYALMKYMHRNRRVAQIDIASRGNFENNAFFLGNDTKRLFVHRVDEDFQYGPGKSVLTNNLILTNYRAYDLVLLRLPRPIENEYLLWLEQIFESTPIVNRPSGIIETSDKSFLLNFQDITPPIRLVKGVTDIREFGKNFPIVMKPLREYGGKGIVKIQNGEVDNGIGTQDLDCYLAGISECVQTEGMLAMKYLKNVSKGDKRIIVVGGTIMAASLRMPAKDSWLCNVALGGTSVSTTVTEEEKNIVNRIAPDLHKKGILIYGVDTLEEDNGKRVLSEINTLSVGGFPDAQMHTGLPIIPITVEKILNYAIAN